MPRQTIVIALPDGEARRVEQELAAAGYETASVASPVELETLLASQRTVALAILDGESDFDTSLDYYSLLNEGERSIPALMVVSPRDPGDPDRGRPAGRPSTTSTSPGPIRPTRCAGGSRRCSSGRRPSTTGAARSSSPGAGSIRVRSPSGRRSSGSSTPRAASARRRSRSTSPRPSRSDAASGSCSSTPTWSPATSRTRSASTRSRPWPTPGPTIAMRAPPRGRSPSWRPTTRTACGSPP